MNAVVALCHFCEQHGPSVLFCSEKGGITREVEETIESLPELGTSLDIPLGSSYPDSMMSADLSKPCSRQSSTKSSYCAACKSLPDGHKGFVSYDLKAGDIFVSSQQPQNPNVFSKVRQACVRSLSCEVCPGREGPIFYGDENDGYVLSYTFYVKDSMARGFQRWYSIIVVMMDRIYLMQSWPFLVECIGKMISYLQKCASDNNKADVCHQRAIRQKASMSKTITPQNFRSNRSSSSNARALIDLTGEQNLYMYLHASFIWMMRACKLRWKEDISCIPPILENVSGNTNCEKEPFPDELCFTSLRHMREVLQPLWFRAIVWHLVIGNQVIWRGDRSVVSSAVRVLAEILPKKCANIIQWSETFVKDSNLLGIPAKVMLPKFKSKDFIYIDIRVKNPPPPYASQTSRRLDTNSVEIRMHPGCVIPEKGPSLLGKLEVALANEDLSDDVVKDYLVCLKQEWMNKTKILHKFVIDKREKEDTNDLLQNCLNCNDHDVRLMWFWMKGFEIPA